MNVKLPPPSFIHLRVRSALSLLQSTINPAALCAWATEQKCPALAVTDDNTMFGALEIAETLANAGVQPIAGLGLSLKTPVPGVLALLACDETGYTNLLHLSSEAFMQQDSGAAPGVDIDTLLSHTDGLICLSGGEDGPAAALAQSGRVPAITQHLEALRDGFGDRLYVELQRHGKVPLWETPLIEAAYALELPLVATHDARFIKPEDHTSQHILMCIGAGASEADPNGPHMDPSQYLKPASQMAELFADIPEALANSVEIARRCSYRPVPREPSLPSFQLEGEQECEALARMAHEGLEKRLACGVLYASTEDYHKQLEYEIGVISNMGFSGYFLIVADFVGWALDQGIPVGPGRGSGAGSLVAYALRITDLDPLRFGLLFERFLNPERVSMPDFDIDFCQDRRGEVIEYVQQKYGHEQVAHIITFGTLQARAVLRDVGRVMQMPFGKVDQLAKLVPFNPAHPPSLQDALTTEPGLAAARKDDEETARLIDVALALEGLYRNASTHAAGLVVADRPIRQLVPLYKDQKSEICATQFSMKWAEAAGLVKFDFLGLKTLTVLARAKALALEAEQDWPQSFYTLNDSKAYELLASGQGLGVFQMESAGMRETLRKVRPDRIEDVIALISLYRPGPMKNIDRFVACKLGHEKPDYLHPDLEPVLKETYGVIVYQEQVMQIARILADYSLAEADLLRRAMGKKKPEEMAQQKTRFISGARAKNVSQRRAETIFELVAEFAGYGFNKSHAAAYAVVSYQTAWVKAYHPASLLAASMSLDKHNTDRLAVLVGEAKRLNVSVLPPDVTSSNADFLVQDGAIRYALSAVKGIGSAAMEALEQERTHAPFLSLADLAERMEPAGFGRRGFETLAAAGAFDVLEPNRARIHAGAAQLTALASAAEAARKSGQSGLFGADDQTATDISLPKCTDWEGTEKLQRERGVIGFHLSGHPLDAEFERYGNRIVSASELEARPASHGHFAMIGLVDAFKEQRSRNNSRFGLASLSDPSGAYELLVPPDQLEKMRDVFKIGVPLRCQVRKRQRQDGTGLVVEKASPIPTKTQALAKTQRSKVRDSAPVPARILLRVQDGTGFEQLAQLLKDTGAGSGCMLYLQLALDGKQQVRLELGRYRLQTSDIHALESVSGIELEEAA